jgi:hypothetical protein
MIGSDRVRFCGECNLNVYNLSAMTRDQAESLIAANDGRLCVRFYRRRDGSIITQDCPVGLRAVQARVSSFAKACMAAALTFMASLGVHFMLLDGYTIRTPAVSGAMALDKPPWPKVVVGTPPNVAQAEEGELVLRKPFRSIKRRPR